MGEMADMLRDQVVDEAILNDDIRCPNCDWPYEPGTKACPECRCRLGEEY